MMAQQYPACRLFCVVATRFRPAVLASRGCRLLNMGRNVSSVEHGGVGVSCLTMPILDYEDECVTTPGTTRHWILLETESFFVNTLEIRHFEPGP